MNKVPFIALSYHNFYLSYPSNFFSLKTLDQEVENVLIEKCTKWRGGSEEPFPHIIPESPTRPCNFCNLEKTNKLNIGSFPDNIRNRHIQRNKLRKMKTNAHVSRSHAYEILFAYGSYSIYNQFGSTEKRAE